MAPTPGTRLGSYEITAQIGVGGMGEVYRATDTNLKRHVAIKVLPASVAADAERLARFQREAEVLAALNHPHIAAIYGLEKTPEFTALVMELVEGDDLSQRIARGAIPVDEALPIAKQIAEALEAAHEQGIIHRDLKPANIKVRPDGTVKVLDFGLAKAMDVGPGGSGGLSMSPTITSPAMTRAGMILGTAAYMSPEQARGKTVDRRADVWAFGAVLFEMLTGTRAFDGDDVADVLSRVLQREPDWAALPPGLASTLLVFLRRCLHKDLKQRIGDIHDVRLALDGAFETAALHATTAASAAPRGRLLWVAAFAVAVAVAAALAGGAVWYLKPDRPGPTMRFAHSLGSEVFTRSGRHLLAVSPDGARLVYVANEQLHLRSLDDTVAHPIAGTAENPNSPAFSPDGQWIAYFASQEIKKVPVGGGTPVAIAQAGNPFGLSWALDNTILYGQTNGIWRVPADGGAAERVVVAADGERLTGPSLLPGGEAVLFGASKTGREDIVVQRLATEARSVVRSGASPRYVSTGHLVFAVGEALLAQSFDPDTLQVHGGPVPVVPQVRRAFATNLFHYAVSDSGTLIYTTGLDSNDVFDLALIDRGGTVTRLPSSSASAFRPRFSPDDRYIAAHRVDQDPPNVWIYEIQQGQWRQLTFDGGTNPTWTPDGKAITYLGRGALWQVASDFSSPPAQLPGTDVPDLIRPEAWSPDGKALLFSSVAGLHAFGPEEKRVSLVLATPDRVDRVGDVTFSPDGRWVAYSTFGNDRYIAISPYPFARGNQRRVVNEPADRPIWSRAGREIFFSRPSGRVSVTEVATEPTLTWKNATTAIDVAVAASGANGASDLSADGQRFLTTLRATGHGDGGRLEIQIVVNWSEDLTRLAPR